MALTADSYAAAFGSPQLEAFKAKGIEVLLMSDRIDEWMIGSLSEYEGKKLKSVAKGEVPLDEADKAKQEEAAKQAEPLLKKLKELLGDRVGDREAPGGEEPIAQPFCHALLRAHTACAGI